MASEKGGGQAARKGKWGRRRRRRRKKGKSGQEGKSLVDEVPLHILAEHVLLFIGLGNSFFAFTCVCRKTKDLCDFETSPVAKEMLTRAKKLYDDGMDQRWGDNGVHLNYDDGKKKIRAAAALGYRPALGQTAVWRLPPLHRMRWESGVPYWELAYLSRDGDSSPWVKTCLGWTFSSPDEGYDDDTKAWGIEILKSEILASHHHVSLYSRAPSLTKVRDSVPQKPQKPATALRWSTYSTTSWTRTVHELGSTSSARRTWLDTDLLATQSTSSTKGFEGRKASASSRTGQRRCRTSSLVRWRTEMQAA